MSNENNQSFGRRIARLRLQHAMTQERLADIANVSAQTAGRGTLIDVDEDDEHVVISLE